MPTLLQAFFHDVRYAGRSILRQPGLMLVVLLTLAIGIGANTAIFSFVMESFYWRYNAPDPEQLYYVRTGTEERPFLASSYDDALRYHEELADLGELATWVGFGAVARLPGQGDDVAAAYRVGRGVTAKAFELLGVRALHGRLFADDEMRPGAPHVVVLQNYYWRRYLGADPGVVGQAVEINGTPFTVIGVLERKEFEPSLASGSLFAPIHQLDDITAAGQLSDPSFRLFETMLRLDHAARPEEAEARLAVLAETLDRAAPWGGGQQRHLTLLGVEDYGDGPGPDIKLLLAAVGLLLLLACANVANLLLARAAGRQREIAVMTAIGASHGRVASRLLVESLLLAVGGALLGLAVARRLLVYMDGILTILPLGLGSWGEGREVPSLDARALLFTLGLAVVTGCLFGLAPILFAGRTDLVAALKTGRGDAPSRRRLGGRRLLVIAQVLISTVLVLGAGLLVRSLGELQGRDQGFASDRLLLTVLATAPPDAAAPREQRAAQLRLYEAARQRIAELPGVSSAALIFQPLAAGYNYRSVVEIPGQVDDGVVTDKVRVGPGIFETYGIELLLGRDFHAGDQEGGVGAIIVNETFARRYWQDGEPLGRELRLPEYADRVEDGRFMVVGVAADVRHGSRRDPPTPLVYLPSSQVQGGSRMTVAARVAGAPGRMAVPVRAAVAAVHPDLALSEIGTYEHLSAVDLYVERLFSHIAGLFGVFGLLIACLGIYSVMSCSVSYRVREIGVRMAVGASRRDVVRLVLGEASTMVVAGVLLGVAAALGLGRLLASQLHGVTATDAPTFLALPLVLAAVGVVAAWLPARRAARLDPKAALLEE